MKSVSPSRMSWLLGLALLLTSCTSTTNSHRSLPDLMVQRLDWMDEVVMAKSIQKLPIFDPKREAELLRTMTQRGVTAGLKAENVRRFFTGQMQAAKVVQEEWLRQHPHGLTSYVTVPNLTQTVRPALDEIGRQMIDQLVRDTRLISSIDRLIITSEARQKLGSAGYSEAVMQPALEGLRAGLQTP